jgi:hypothetical protein
MNNPEIMNPRPNSVLTALLVGWLWIAVVSFKPLTLWCIGANFYAWLPLALLFSIPLVAKGWRSGRIALNVILPVALLYGGIKLLRVIDSMLPQTLILFLFRFSLELLPLLIVLICINHHSATAWFNPGSATRAGLFHASSPFMSSKLGLLVSRLKLDVYFKEVILGLCFAAVWVLMLGVAMVCASAICWPILFFVGACIEKPAEVGFFGVAAFYAMVVACLSILLAGLPAGFYIVTKDEARKAVYRKYFRRMIYGGLGVLIALILVMVIALIA